MRPRTSCYYYTDDSARNSHFTLVRLNNGDTYAGHWRENQRHGHGLMKCGALSSAAATVYIGEWVQDKKHGYGVMDDIIRSSEIFHSTVQQFEVNATGLNILM